VTTRLLAVFRTVTPDADGLCEVKHDLGIMDVRVTLHECEDADAMIGVVQPISPEDVEVVVSTTSPCTFLVGPDEPPVLDEAAPSPAEVSRQRRWGS
jgi:hypothetical protein